MSKISSFVIFDNIIDGNARYLSNLVSVDYVDAENVADIDRILEDGWAQNLHCALYLPYEFGLQLVFSKKEFLELQQQRGFEAGSLKAAIYWFRDLQMLDESGLEDVLTESGQLLNPDGQPSGVANLQKDTHYADFEQSIDHIVDAIATGDYYQINYTIRMHFDVYGSPPELYQLLRKRQAVSYASISCLSDTNGALSWTLSLSPELFIELDKDCIRTEPMKGTLAVSSDQDLETQKLQLQSDEKNRSENLMIVDLLRNDLSQLSKPNGVRVEELFRVTRFGQVLQMTTPITAVLKEHISVFDMLRALYPCGSITGAPKHMAMKTIHRLETSDREIYTGSIGWLEPDSNGDIKGVLNVAIRTLVLKQINHCSYKGMLGVGGGIVHDSTASNEYDEIDWKSRFIKVHSGDFHVFETMAVRDRRCALIDDHLKRLKNSLDELFIETDFAALQRDLLVEMDALPDTYFYRFKIIVEASDGSYRFEHAYMQEAQSAEPKLIALADLALPDSDPLRRFKTSRRGFYDEQIARSGLFDLVFANQSGQLLEGGRTSLFLKLSGNWYTPSLDLDILPGVMRQQILGNTQKYLQTDFVEEAVLDTSHLLKAEKIILSNALRGLVKVRLA